MNNITKTAMITICGRPNVGKSSLTNALVGETRATVSDKPQTTRNRIYGVVNREDTQFVLLDTPGLHKPRSRLGDYMVKVVRESLQQVEAALLRVEPIAHVGEPEKILLERIREHFGKPVTITSAYRTPANNAKAGGAKFSQHLYGRAADIRVQGVSVEDVAAYAESLMPDRGGVGRYPVKAGRATGWVHVDTRADKARWRG